MGRRKPEVRRNKRRRQTTEEEAEISVVVNGNFMYGEQELKEGDRFTMSRPAEKWRR